MHLESTEARNQENGAGADPLVLLRSNFRQLIHELIIFNNRIIRKEGLAMAQMVVLKHLQYDSPKSVSSIAQSLGVSKPTVTGIMNTLEKDGYITRNRDGADRREVIISLTDKSRKLFDSLESQGGYLMDELFSSIPQRDIENFSNAMKIVIGKIREKTGKCEDHARGEHE